MIVINIKNKNLFFNSVFLFCCVFMCVYGVDGFINLSEEASSGFEKVIVLLVLLLFVITGMICSFLIFKMMLVSIGKEFQIYISEDSIKVPKFFSSFLSTDTSLVVIKKNDICDLKIESRNGEIKAILIYLSNKMKFRITDDWLSEQQFLEINSILKGFLK